MLAPVILEARLAPSSTQSLQLFDSLTPGLHPSHGSALRWSRCGRPAHQVSSPSTRTDAVTVTSVGTAAGSESSGTGSNRDPQFGHRGNQIDGGSKSARSTRQCGHTIAGVLPTIRIV